MSYPKGALIDHEVEEEGLTWIPLKLAKLYIVGMIPESHFVDDERIRRDMPKQGIKLGKLVPPQRTASSLN